MFNSNPPSYSEWKKSDSPTHSPKKFSFNNGCSSLDEVDQPTLSPKKFSFDNGCSSFDEVDPPTLSPKKSLFNNWESSSNEMPVLNLVAQKSPRNIDMTNWFVKFINLFSFCDIKHKRANEYYHSETIPNVEDLNNEFRVVTDEEYKNFKYPSNIIMVMFHKDIKKDIVMDIKELIKEIKHSSPKNNDVKSLTVDIYNRNEGDPLIVRKHFGVFKKDKFDYMKKLIPSVETDHDLMSYMCNIENDNTLNNIKIYYYNDELDSDIVEDIEVKENIFKREHSCLLIPDEKSKKKIKDKKHIIVNNDFVDVKELNDETGEKDYSNMIFDFYQDCVDEHSDPVLKLELLEIDIINNIRILKKIAKLIHPWKNFR